MREQENNYTLSKSLSLYCRLVSLSASLSLSLYLSLVSVSLPLFFSLLLTSLRGTFNLAEFYLSSSQPGDLKELTSSATPVLELGSATGLLALRFSQAGVSMVTSDYDDTASGEECIEANIVFNYGLNAEASVPHIPHTWGEPWPEGSLFDGGFEIVLASDILLYTAAYSALVQTLLRLFVEGRTTKFVMSWDRRMDESKEFFEMMKEAGFKCTLEPKCIFVFEREEETEGGGEGEGKGVERKEKEKEKAP